MRERRFRAPARVNLIGGQVDYHEGIVVGHRDRPRGGRRGATAHATVALSRGRPSSPASSTSRPTADDLPSAVLPAWGRAVAGVVAMLAEHGRDPIGADLDISSTVPLGAGLSSSAAFEVAVALALGDVAGLALPMRELALVAQRAEHVAMGVPCGIQDQLTSLAGVAGQAVRIDCRTLEVEPRPIPAEVGVVVVNSGVARTLEGSPWLRAPRRQLHGRGTARPARASRRAPGPSRGRAARPPRRFRDRACERVRGCAPAGRRRRARSAPPRIARVVTRRHGGVRARARRARRGAGATRVRTARASRAAASAVASSRSYRSSGHRTSRQRRQPPTTSAPDGIRPPGLSTPAAGAGPVTASD